MLKSFIKGIYQLNDRATWKVMIISVVIAIAVFGLLWFIIGYLLINHALIRINWLDTLIDVLGGLATLALTWFLFPGIISAVTTLFLERMAAAVEARHYPNLPEVAEPPIAVAASIKFLAVMISTNLFILIFLFVPPVFPFVFYGGNGYLLGREYFELVAHRRMGVAETKALRKTHQGELFFTGVVIAGLLTIPLVNLLTPVVAIASMVHLFESWRLPMD